MKTARPVTPPQAALLRILAGRHAMFGPHLSRAETLAALEEWLAEEHTLGEASALIDRARLAPTRPAEERPAPEWLLRALRAEAERTALYGLGVSRQDTVTRIEAVIAAGLSEAAARRLLTQARHAPAHPTPATPIPLAVIDGIDDVPVYEGHFAVSVAGSLRFYRIHRPTQGAHSGQPVIRRFTGEASAAITPGEARAALRAIAEDPDAAAFRFADEQVRCWLCARRLTDPVSRLLSVGPDCRGFPAGRELRAQAAAVDADLTRRAVYRALRAWALTTQPPQAPSAQDAAAVAAAWSSLPGMLHREPDAAVALARRAFTGDLDPQLRDGLLAAPAEPVLLLVSSRALSAPVLTALAAHPSRRVRDAVGNLFLTLLAG